MEAGIGMDEDSFGGEVLGPVTGDGIATVDPKLPFPKRRLNDISQAGAAQSMF